MGDDRVDAFAVHNHIERGGPCRSDDVGLHAFEMICGIAAFPDVIPHLGDGMQSREVIGTAIDEIEANSLPRLRLQELSPLGGVDRIVSENTAVEDYIIVFA